MSAGVYDVAKSQGLPVRAVNVGEAASNRENCMRLRIELWFRGREWFQERSCSIPQDDELIAELTAPIYTFTVTGKMVVERKEVLNSPDLADAFLLSLWAEAQDRSAWQARDTEALSLGGVVLNAPVDRLDECQRS